jgi:NADP-dependent aldehyde dehydrogenase
VGFTGSLAGGRALYDICAARDEPIPFYGELGSVNPMFLLPEALSARGNSIAAGWAGSLTMGAGQFCTNPGIAVMIGGAAADAFAATATGALGEVDPQDMLTEGIASAFSSGMERIKSSSGVHELLSTSCDCRRAAPYLYQTTGKEWLANPSLGEEVFGPLGMIVVVDDAEEMITVANALQGQLTCTLHLDDADTELARSLMPVLERKAGRILANGFPTGVEVCDSMVHGGPYPASTNFGATSVGTMSIRRFLRPVSYQNIPAAILPADLA